MEGDISRNLSQTSDHDDYTNYKDLSLNIDDNLPKNEQKKGLNKNFFNESGELFKEIRDEIINSIEKLYNELSLDIKLDDILIIGSLADFYYSNKSDIDICLSIEDLYDELEEMSLKVAEERMEEIINGNEINGHPIHLEIKKKDNIPEEKGIYSVAKDKWILAPKKENNFLNKKRIIDKTSNIMDKVDGINNIHDDQERSKKIDELSNAVHRYKKCGLETSGEGCVEFNVFKLLEKYGYLDKLKLIKDSVPTTINVFEEENKPSKENKGCLMLDLNFTDWDSLTINNINKEDVYDDKEGNYGMEDEPHVTVLFGIHDEEIDQDDLIKEVRNTVQDAIKLNLLGISCFYNDEYDVLKIDIRSSQLEELNKRIKEKFPYTEFFSEYKPHITLAYLKKGEGKKYEEGLGRNEEIEIVGSHFRYSNGNGKKILFPLSKERKVFIQKDANIPKDYKPVIKKFVNYACDFLNIGSPVRISLRKKRDENITTTAAYSPYYNRNYIRAEGRALVDILRSIGHELTHNKQMEDNRIVEGSGEDGSCHENEANSNAGIMIRKFGRNNPIIYDI